VEWRDGVRFPNGDAMTADDFRYTFFERLKSPDKIDTKNLGRIVSDIAGHSPSFPDFVPLNPGYGRISGRLYQIRNAAHDHVKPDGGDDGSEQ
jgi:ABC-type transport system substrate-binding protein